MKATIDKCRDAEKQLATLREQYRNEHPYCKNYACKNNCSLNKNVCLLYNYYADECKDYVEEETTVYKPKFSVGIRIKYSGTSYVIIGIVNNEKYQLRDVESDKEYEYDCFRVDEYAEQLVFKAEDFKPFDFVIVRSKESGKRAVWQSALFSHLEQDAYDGKFRRRYVASNERWDFCLPHNKETDALIGTNLPYDGFYRTW